MPQRREEDLERHSHAATDAASPSCFTSAEDAGARHETAGATSHRPRTEAPRSHRTSPPGYPQHRIIEVRSKDER